MIDALRPYISIIIFYTLVVGFLIIKRKNIFTQLKVIVFYRTKIGIKLIDQTVEKYEGWIKLLGHIGIGVGFIGMIIIIVMLILNLYNLFITPAAQNGVSLALPGLTVPGIGVLSFWYWIIALFIIAFVHEFGHGIIARAYKLPIKSTGFFLLGPLLGAFVELDEKKVAKQPSHIQHSIVAAGPWMNILLTVIAFLILSLLISPGLKKFEQPLGVSFSNYLSKNLPAEEAMLPTNVPITQINNQKILNSADLYNALKDKPPGTEVTIVSDKEYKINLAEFPDDPTKGYLGITNIKNEFTIKQDFSGGGIEISYNLIKWIKQLFQWIAILSLGVGLFNLLPVPLIDGGRMLQVAFTDIYGTKRGLKKFSTISLFFLLLLIATFLIPVIRKFI